MQPPNVNKPPAEVISPVKENPCNNATNQMVNYFCKWIFTTFANLYICYFCMNTKAEDSSSFRIS